MTVRQLATAFATAFVAICVAVAVPVSQLRVRTVVITCCCPDPAKCHCPDHKPVHGDRATMRACHKSQHELASADAPSFTPPLPVAPAPQVAMAYIELPTRGSPKASPDPAPPYGPS